MKVEESPMYSANIPEQISQSINLRELKMNKEEEHMDTAPKGMYVPIVTPFREDQSIDFDAFKKVIDYAIENGVDGMLIAGGTG